MRLRSVFVLAVIVLALGAAPSHAGTLLASCSGSATGITMTSKSCTAEFFGAGSVLIKLRPGRLYTGSLTAAVVSTTNGFSVNGTFVAGVLIDGLQEAQQTLDLGDWHLHVIPGQDEPVSIGRFTGSVETVP